MLTDYIKQSPFSLDALRWWEKRRLRYNIGLLVAGVLAFGAYAAVVVRYGDIINAADPSQADEFSGFTLVFQGVGYLFMMFVANVCFLLGPLSERWVEPGGLAHYREKAFRFGFWFSVALPFANPVLLLANLWRGAFVPR
jgi:hypothetical protein